MKVSKGLKVNKRKKLRNIWVVGYSLGMWGEVFFRKNDVYYSYKAAKNALLASKTHKTYILKGWDYEG